MQAATAFDRVREATARAAADEAGGVDPALLGDFLAELAAVAGSGAALPENALAACRALGARAADDGVPLRALVDLYLSAACRSAVRREESARREFVDDLLGGTGDIGALTARAEEFGLDLGGPHLLTVATAPAPFADATPILSQVEDAVGRAAGGGDTLVTTKEGQLTCVLPAGGSAAVDEMVENLSAALSRGLGRSGWRIGVGRAYPGAAGVLRSYEEARDALDLAARLDLPAPVARAVDLLVYQVLLRDRAAITDLIDTVLSPLTTARGGAGPLLETLAAYA